MKKTRVEKSFFKKQFLVFFLTGSLIVCAHAQTPNITLDLTKTGARVSPMLYGLMTEEINHSYDGGLYAELIRNRVIKDNANRPEGWSLVNDDSVHSTANMK